MDYALGTPLRLLTKNITAQLPEIYDCSASGLYPLVRSTHLERASMKKNIFRVAVVLGLLAAFVMLPFAHAGAQDDTTEIPFASADPIPAKVFQAAGPTTTSIQSSVDEYRAALGIQNNGNTAGPLLVGRREINWDGGLKHLCRNRIRAGGWNFCCVVLCIGVREWKHHESR